MPQPVGIAAAAFVAAAATLHAFGVRQLVPEAALQAAAQSGQPRGIQAEILLLGHLDRHRLERVQPGRAAQRAAAGAVSAEHLRFVARADLPHLDARVKLGRELADQLAKIDAPFGGEIKNQPRPVEQLLDARQLHLEPALANLEQRDAMRFLLALLPLEAHRHVFERSPSGRRDWENVQGAARRSSTTDGVATIEPTARSRLRLHDDLVAGHRRRIGKQQIVQQERLRPPDRRELDRDEAKRVSGHYLVRMGPHPHAPAVACTLRDLALARSDRRSA